MRSTAMISATSDSTAATTSAVDDVVLGGHGEQPLARLRQRGEGLQRFEGLRQAPAVALVLVARSSWSWRVGGGLRTAGSCRVGLRLRLPAAALKLLPACFRLPTLVSPTPSPLGAYRLILSAVLDRWLSRAPAGLATGTVQLALRAASSAASIRPSVSSRPNSATLSKMPGEIAVPAIATRSGW